MPDLFHRPVPLVAWTPLRTPTLPPAKFTNCGVFGGSHFAIIDAGATLQSERDRLVEMVRTRQAQGHTLEALLLTHHHPDHIGAMPHLREVLQVPIYAHRDCAALVDFEVDRFVEEGDVIEFANQDRISVHETPGHAQGHVIYRHEASRWCYAGDLVIGRGSVLIDERDGGSVIEYLNSLKRVRSLCQADHGPATIEVLLPGHGQPIRNTVERIDQLISHRLYREQQLLDLLSIKPRDLGEVIATIYADKSDDILPFARATIRSHMRKLVAESRVQLLGHEQWKLSPPMAPSEMGLLKDAIM